MANEFICAAVFTKVASDHLGLDLNRVESLSIVDCNNRPNHLRNDNHLRGASAIFDGEMRNSIALCNRSIGNEETLG